MRALEALDEGRAAELERELLFVDWLAMLARMDTRKRERALARFAPREGQPDAEAGAVRAKLARDQAFREQGYAWLLGEKARRLALLGRLPPGDPRWNEGAGAPIVPS